MAFDLYGPIQENCLGWPMGRCFVWNHYLDLIMPVLGTTPAPWQMPFEEHFSEFFGHIVWGWSIAAVGYYLIAKQKVKTLTNQYW